MASSDVQPDGTYAVTVSFGPDSAVTLDQEGAVAYAAAVLEAGHAAEHDALILAELQHVGTPDRAALEVVAQVRARRGDTKATGTDLVLVPGISSRTRKGFVTIKLGGKPIGQWDLADVRDHASAVLDASAVARLDSAYYTVLRETVQVDEPTARAMVGDLGRFRDDAGTAS